jgi:hypothetical protein
MAYFASLTATMTICMLEAPKEVAVSVTDLSTPLYAEITRPIIIGDMSKACPKMIALGLKSQPRSPSGPARDSREKIMRPTRTVGIQYRDCSTLTSKPLPRNVRKWIRLPRGKQMRTEMTQEVAANHSDLPAALHVSEPKETNWFQILSNNSESPDH